MQLVAAVAAVTLAGCASPELARRKKQPSPAPPPTTAPRDDREINPPQPGPPPGRDGPVRVQASPTPAA